MKWILLILFLLIPIGVNAADVTMAWTKAVIEDDLAGFNVYHSTDPQEGFSLLETLTGKDVRQYTHTDAPDCSWWYVTAYDTSGNESQPSNIADNVAPSGVIVRVEVIQ